MIDIATTVASLAVQVTSNTQQAQQALIGLTTVMKGVGFEALAMVGIVAGIGAIGVISTKMAGDFQSSTETLVTGAGLAQDQLGKIRAGILQMAVDTGTSTQQLVAGEFMISSANLKNADTLVILKAAAEGAKVGHADLGVVADAVTTVMKDYNLTTKDAVMTTNLMVGTVKLGKTHFEDLAGSISTVLPVASKFGVSLGDVMAGMATMTAHGIDAANAATYLRQMIVSLEAPTTAGAKAMASVGLSVQEVNDDIRNKGLPATLQIITTAIGKTFPAGSAAANEAFKEIAGGSRQMQGMLALTGTTAAEFAADAANLGGIVHSTSDAVSGWSAVQGTFNQHMDVLREVVETNMIEIGQKLLPVATQFIGFITNTAIPGIMNFITMIQGTSKEAQTLRPILLVLGIAIAGALVAAFIAWTVTAGAAAVATIAATWPILAAGAAIGLLVAGLIYAYNNWGWFKTAVDAARNNLGLIIPTFQMVTTWVGNLFQQIGKLVNMLDSAAGSFNNMANSARNAVNSIPAVGGILSHIPGFATGGTMPDTGLALVGEQGPELITLPGGSNVTPLTGSNAISGPPTGMSIMPAGASGYANGQPLQITLYVDKTKLGQVAVAAIPGAVRNGTGARAF